MLKADRVSVFAALGDTDTIIKEAKRRRAIGGDLHVISRAVHFLERLKKLGLMAALGEDQVFPDKHAAINAIVPTVKRAISQRWDKKIFRECASMSSQRPS